MWSGPLVCINLVVISLCFDCLTVPCCIVHSLPGFAEILCTEMCSVSLQIRISETAADRPPRFTAAVYLLPNSEQNFLRFLVTFLSLDLSETRPLNWLCT